MQLELPLGTSFDTTRDRLRQLERDLLVSLPQQDILASKITIGHHDLPNEASVTEGRQPSWGLIDVYLVRQSERTYTSTEIASRMRDFLVTQRDFLLARVVPQENSPPTGEAVELDIVGNSDDRYLAAEQVTRFLRETPGVSRVWTSYKRGKDIIDLQLKHELLANYGLTVQDVTRAVRVAFDGLLVEEMQTVDERIRFRLQYRQPEQGQLETLYGLVLINARGEPVLLRSVADFETKPAQATVFHYFGERTMTVYADIDKSRLSVAEINRKLANFLEQQNLRARYSQLNFVQGGEADRQQDALGNIASAALLSLAGILVLLVLLFNSVSQPVLVLLVIPLGILGVMIAFALQGLVLSMSALAGITGLAGILVNDSLIMIDQLNRARSSDGTISSEVLVQTASTRLRPIFITTLTTVAGLYPVAYGLFGLNIVVAPLAMVMLWGVVFGSIITLFYLPSMYALEQDIRRLFRRR